MQACAGSLPAGRVASTRKAAKPLPVDQRLHKSSLREVRCHSMGLVNPPGGLTPTQYLQQERANLTPPARDYGDFQKFVDSYVDEATYYNPFGYQGIRPADPPPESNVHHFGVYTVSAGGPVNGAFGGVAGPANTVEKEMIIDQFGLDGAPITWPDGTIYPNNLINFMRTATPAQRQAIAPASGVVHKPVFIMDFNNRQDQRWERWELAFNPEPVTGWAAGNLVFQGSVLVDGDAAPIGVRGVYKEASQPRLNSTRVPPAIYNFVRGPKFTPKHLCTTHTGHWQPTYGTPPNAVKHFDDPNRQNKPYWGWVLSLGFASEETRSLLESFRDFPCANGLAFKYNTWWDKNNIGFVNNYELKRDPIPLRVNPQAKRPFKVLPQHPLTRTVFKAPARNRIPVSDGTDWMFMYIDAIYHAWKKEREDYKASFTPALTDQQIDNDVAFVPPPPVPLPPNYTPPYIGHANRPRMKGGMIVVLSKSYFTKEVNTFDPTAGQNGRGAFRTTLVRNDNCMREMAYINRYREARIPVKFIITDLEGRKFFNSAIKGKLLKPESGNPAAKFDDSDVVVDYNHPTDGFKAQIRGLTIFS